MKKRKSILLIVLLMAVGFAAVSTTLYINGQTKINANQDDFNVYYSNALVNGVQDLSVVESETVLTFTTTLSTLGETYELDYEVTNGSKNYDAELTMECTQGNDYLTVTNEFDTDTNLEALQTRSGKLTLELIKSYAGSEDLDVTITCTINANAIERGSLGEGEVEEPIYPFKWVYIDSDVSGDVSVGDVYSLGAEKFNVISQTDDSIIMLASNVLGINYLQTKSTTTSEYAVIFADTDGWEYTPGPKEIDVQTWSPNITTYINEYVSYLNDESGSTSITGDLITLAQLGELGCIYPSDYMNTGNPNTQTCANSEYISWLITGQKWWTRSANSKGHISFVWTVSSDLGGAPCNGTAWGVRPVITIDKSDLENL